MDRSLRRVVLERLAAVEEMAVRTGSHLSVRAARTHLMSITCGWRELLLEHQPDLKGRCPVCSGWLRRRRWPCQVWMTAHEHLIGDGPDPVRVAAKKSATFRRPRRVEVIPRQLEASSAADQTGGPRHAGSDQPATPPIAAGPPAEARRNDQWTPPEGLKIRQEIPELPATEYPPATTTPRTRRGWRSRA